MPRDRLGDPVGAQIEARLRQFATAYRLVLLSLVALVVVVGLRLAGSDAIRSQGPRATSTTSRSRP